MGTNDRTLNIVGESYRNEDGTSRQEEIKRCRAGEIVQLRREPSNPHDPSAVAVDSARYIQIGYLSREHARWIGEKIDRGHDVRAIIDWVHGGKPGKPSRGVCIRINTNGEDPDQPGLWAALKRFLRKR